MRICFSLPWLGQHGLTCSKRLKVTKRQPDYLRGGLYALGLHALFVFSSAHADVRMPAIFGDHMVLQQDRSTVIWGWADPGENVTVTLGTGKATAIAGADGKWRTELPGSSTREEPQTLTVSGKNTLTFTDVLIGDVWLAAGQSNMEFPTKMAHNAATEVPAATDPEIRFFLVPRLRALHPLEDFSPVHPGLYDNSSFFASNGFGLNPEDAGKWMVCTPETAGNFSGVAYFFAKDLRAQFKRPVGVIGSYFGGSPAESWTSYGGLFAEPTMHGSLYGYQLALEHFIKGDADMEEQYGSFRAKQEKWEKDIAADPAGPAWQKAFQDWRQNLNALQKAGQPTPPEPRPPIPRPQEPSNGFVPTLLFNGMIAPLIPYTIQGVIWYQGESNANVPGASLQYRLLFTRLITDWREKWGQGDLPFLYVQLAGNNAHPATAGDVSPWGYMRETQEKVLALPKTGLATAMDIGMTTNIHPPDKQDVGRRLALVARRVAYGEDVLDSGPVFQSEKIEGNQVRISFSNIGSGLTIGTPPWTDPALPPPPSAELTGFAIAGTDGKWGWATAKIEGNDVIVSSDQVPNPVAVRYAWADNPIANLYNKDGLPAWPFRTDNWN